MFETYKNLPKTIYVLFFVQIINRLGEFVFPFFTFYLTQKLGMSAAETSLFVMLAPMTFIPGNFLGGYLADALGRKKAYLLTQSTAALMLLPCAFLPTGILNVILILGATFFGSAVRPAISAMIADELPASERHRGFSLSYMGINIGVAIGPLLAGFLFENAMWLFFLGDVLTSFIAVILVFVMVPPKSESYDEKHLLASEKNESGGVIKALLDRPLFLGFIFVGILYSVVYTQINFLLPLTLTGLFAGKGALYFGIMMSVNAVTVVVMTLPMTHLMNGRRPLLGIALTGIIYAVGFGMIPSLRSIIGFCISTFIWTLGEVLVSMYSGVLTANYSPVNLRGSFSAVSSLSWSIGGALGTLMAGKLFGFIGTSTLWYGISALALIGAGLGYALLKAENKQDKSAKV